MVRSVSALEASSRCGHTVCDSLIADSIDDCAGALGSAFERNHVARVVSDSSISNGVDCAGSKERRCGGKDDISGEGRTIPAAVLSPKAPGDSFSSLISETRDARTAIRSCWS